MCHHRAGPGRSAYLNKTCSHWRSKKPTCVQEKFLARPLNGNQADVVFEFLLLREGLYLGEDLIEYLRRRQFAAPAKRGHQSVETEFLLVRSVHFIHTVGEEDEEVASGQRAAAGGIGRFLEQSQRRAVAGVVGAQRFHD